MEAIATYSANAIDWKSDFALFPDAVLMRYSRGIMGQRGEQRFPLAMLDPAHIHGTFRRDGYIIPGGLIALGSLAVGIRLFAAHAISWPLIFVAATLVLGILLIRMGLRMVEYAEFRTQAGASGFQVPCFRHTREEFEAFVSVVEQKIEEARRAA